MPDGVKVVSMQLRGHAGGELDRGAVMAMVDGLLARGGDLFGIRVSGKEAEGVGRKQPVDLLKDHLSETRVINPARGHRFALPERWVALHNILVTWLATRQLAVL